MFYEKLTVSYIHHMITVKVVVWDSLTRHLLSVKDFRGLPLTVIDCLAWFLASGK